MIFTDLANELKLCYTYDTLSRVIKRTAVSLDNSKTIISTESFNYNPAGNLAVDGFEYDANNRLTMYNNVVVYYDSDGNMICSPLGEGFFDSSNRLTSFNTTSYDYDVENIRVRKTYGETVTAYTHNASSKLSQLLMKTENNVATKYVYGLGLIYETTETDCKVYHYDYRGSTVALTETNGNVTDTFEYDTYGKLLTRIGTTETPFLYNGRDGVMTDENGLVYMRARYYSPTLKRFINADVVAGSITNAITLNRYAYANGNPVSNVDPFGLCPDERGNMTSSIVVKSRIGRHSRSRYGLEDSLRTFLKFKTSYNFDMGWKTESLAIGMTLTPFGDKTYIPYALYDSDRNSRPGVFSDTILSGEIELPNYNVTENELTVFSGDINLMTGCWHMGDVVDLALLDIGHAELDLSFSDSGFEANALISAWSPSITLDFGGYEIEFSFEVGAIGAKASLDLEKGEWSLGVAKGLGFTISGGRSDD